MNFAQIIAFIVISQYEQKLNPDFYKFTAALGTNDLDTIKKVAPYWIPEKWNNFDIISGSFSDLEVVKWYRDYYGIKRRVHHLQIVCLRGKVEIANWLQETYNFTREEVLKDKLGYGITRNLNGSRWLIETFKITREDVLTARIFSDLCANGSDEVIHYLIQTFSLKRVDFGDSIKTCDVYSREILE
jgi:hypothetical protein